MAVSGTVLAGHFDVDMRTPLGSGGMAIVYRGRDLRTGRDVAIKTLRPEYAADPDSRARFRREARLMAFVKHPNLVTIYDLHEDSSGSWVVMEYVPGPTLKALIQDEGPMAPEAVYPILRQLAGAFSAFHGNQLVHLDIKPQNIIIRPDGTAKLIDFGLAQPAGTAQQTDGGVAFGTVAYLAPEQATGDIVDATSDIYSLGCVVYEMLTGQPPFTAPEGPDHQRTLIQAHLTRVPVAPSKVRPELQLPAWVDDVVGWAMAKDRHDRYHDVETFARMFLSGLEGEVVPQSDLTAAMPRVPRPVAPTGRIPAPVRTAPEPEIATLEPSAPSTFSRMYQAGGRAARRTKPVRRLLWQLTFVLFIGNLLLGSVLMVQDGPGALVERFLAVAPGTSTEVIIDDLNLRAAPDLEADVLTTLPEGTDVRVTGLSESGDGERWWPVEVEQDGQTYDGYVWDEGLQGNEWTGRMSWMQGVVDRVNGVRRGINDGWDNVTDVWPF